jgi:predicted transcriptional regulator
MAQKNFTITEFRKTCSRFLQTTKTKNRKFSLRKFAKEADIPASTLSKFINGKVRISENQIDTLCRVMKVS